MYVDQPNAKPNVTVVGTSLRTLINTDIDGLFGIVKAAYKTLQYSPRLVRTSYS